MLRKIVTVSFLSFTSAWASASNIYLGLGIGPVNANFNQSAQITGPFLNVKDKTRLAGIGIFSDIFGGWAWQNQNFFLAGEVNLDFSAVEFKSSNDNFPRQNFSQTIYKMRHSYGLSVLPGYFFTPLALFYARFGAANGNFKISTTDSSLKNINTYLVGFRYGFGIKQTVSDHFDARMEYSHISYRTANFSTNTAVLKRTKVAPETGQVEFAIVYNLV